MTTYGVDRSGGAGGTGSSSTVLFADGSVPLTDDWNAGIFKITANQFESVVATGTAPFVVASTTKVTNLNADLLDGLTSADFVQVLDASWVDLTDAGATTLHKHDHGGQDGLADDDHTQYALLAGRSGGQTITGGTAASDPLTLDSTSNSTKGAIILGAAGAGSNVQIGGGTSASELRIVEPSGGGSSYTAFKAPAMAGSVTYTLPTGDGSTANSVLSTNGSTTMAWLTPTALTAALIAATTSAQGVSELATSAEVLTGTDATRTITPSTFAGNKSLASSGYYKFPGGLIIQWAQVSTDANGDATWTFPTSFASACYAVVASDRSGDNFRVATTGQGNTGNCAIYTTASGSSVSSTCYCVAIGV